MMGQVFIPERLAGSFVDPSKKATGTKSKEKAKSDAIKAKRALHAKVQRNLIGLPEYTQEVRFHPTRQWRFDYAWPELKIAVEIHGGVHSQGRHVRGTGYESDREKMNEAQLHGWLVLEVTPKQVGTLMRNWIERAMENKKCIL